MPPSPLTSAGKVVMLKALADRLNGGKLALYDAQQNVIAELALGDPAFEPIQHSQMQAHPIAPEEGANLDADVVLGVLHTPEGQALMQLPVHSEPGEPGIAMSGTHVELGGQVRLDALVVRW